MKKVLTVVGTRPNIIKITQFHRVCKNYPNIDHRLIHTGQHYSTNMSDVFFEELQLPLPSYSLDVDKSSVVKQLAGIMTGLEKTIKEAFFPDLLIVVGDVNSTLAAALVGNKMGIPTAHLESGLRSFDSSMPEEHNRILTDKVADYFFVTEQSGYDNLIKEGVHESKLHFVGNTMIDTLVGYDKEIKASNILKEIDCKPEQYILMTMHRPGNVDSKEGLLKLVDVINKITQSFNLVFPIHPRSLKMLSEFNLLDSIKNNPAVKLLEPTGYLDFQHLILNSFCVITDSGGIQEETTFRQVPCITLRPNTERPVTVDLGTNTLMEFNVEEILQVIDKIKNKDYKKGAIPPKWDGKSTERIFEIINSL